MKLWIRILLTVCGLVLVATELLGDIPGAAVGVGLIAFAWLEK